jgi:hypothetical protein
MVKIFEKILVDNKTLFAYIIIFILIIFSFSTINIELNIIFGTFIACILIYYLYGDYKKKQKEENKIKSVQESYLLPKPQIFEKYNNVIKFMFSIQDLYVYNPQAYEEITENLANFLRTFEEIQNNPKKSSINYTLMVNYKRNATNSLHSIIYNLPNDIQYTNKLNKAIVILQEILDNFLYKVEKIHNNYIYENGYNIETKIIKNDQLPYNAFDNGIKSLYTFDLF